MSEPAPVNQFEFTPEKERQALKIIMTDSTFVTKWINRLQPEHFQHDWSQLIFRAISGFFKKEGHLPAFDTLTQIVRNHCLISDPSQDILRHLRTVASETPTDVHFTKEMILEHMKQHDYRSFAITFAESVRDRKYDAIGEGIRQIILRHGTVEMPREYLEDSAASRVAIENQMMKSIASPWPTLNANHGGGFEASAVTVFMGPSGSGKSVMLANVGAHFLNQGKTVYHFTFELSEMMTKARYDVILSGITHKDRKVNPAAIDDWLKKRRTATPPLGKLYVIERPTGTCTMNDVMAAIEEQKILSKSLPDLIILDYLTIMAPNNPDTVEMDNDYSKLKVIAEEARAMAMMLKLPVVTAVQSNRGSIDKETIKGKDIADSYAVIHVVDLVLTINQNDLEKAAEKTRLYVTKSRNHKDEYSIVCDVKYENLRVTEDTMMTENYNKSVFAKRTDPRTVESALKSPMGQVDPTANGKVGASAAGTDAVWAMIGGGPKFKAQGLEAPVISSPTPAVGTLLMAAPVVAEPTPPSLNITRLSNPSPS